MQKLKAFTRNSSWGLILALIALTRLFPVTSAEVHWAHVIDPPTFTLQTWNDPEKGGYSVACEGCNLTNCISVTDRNFDILVLHQPPFVMLPVKVNGTWYEHSGLQVLIRLCELLTRPNRFLGMLIAGLVAVTSLIATATTAAIALTQEIHTARYVEDLAKNMSVALGAQERIDRKLEQKIDVLEQTVLLLGDQLQNPKLRASLRCHTEFNNICVTPKFYNASS